MWGLVSSGVVTGLHLKMAPTLNLIVEITHKESPFPLQDWGFFISRLEGVATAS